MTFLTPEEIAQETRLTVVTIRRLCDRGAIKGHKLAGRWRISPDAYADWLARGEVREPPGVVKPAPRGTMTPPRRQFRALVGGANVD